MKKNKKIIVLLLFVLIVSCVLFSWCSKNKDTGTDVSQESTVEQPKPIEPSVIMTETPEESKIEEPAVEETVSAAVVEETPATDVPSQEEPITVVPTVVEVLAEKVVETTSEPAKEPESEKAPVVAESTCQPVEAEPEEPVVKDNSQCRTTVGFKIGPDVFDVEGTLALLPHWFAVVSLGGTTIPDDFVDNEFGLNYTVDEDFMYTALLGTGFNYRIKAGKFQPELYISTMVGPAIFVYTDVDDELDAKSFLFWRNSVGVDIPLYKGLCLTAEFNMDWMRDYDWTPVFGVGFIYRFNMPALFSRK